MTSFKFPKFHPYFLVAVAFLAYFVIAIIRVNAVDDQDQEYFTKKMLAVQSAQLANFDNRTCDIYVDGKYITQLKGSDCKDSGLAYVQAHQTEIEKMTKDPIFGILSKIQEDVAEIKRMQGVYRHRY